MLAANQAYVPRRDPASRRRRVVVARRKAKRRGRVRRLDAAFAGIGRARSRRPHRRGRGARRARGGGNGRLRCRVRVRVRLFGLGQLGELGRRGQCGDGGESPDRRRVHDELVHGGRHLPRRVDRGAELACRGGSVLGVLSEGDACVRHRGLRRLGPDVARGAFAGMRRAIDVGCGDVRRRGARRPLRGRPIRCPSPASWPRARSASRSPCSACPTASVSPRASGNAPRRRFRYFNSWQTLPSSGSKLTPRSRKWGCSAETTMASWTKSPANATESARLLPAMTPASTHEA